MCDADINRRAFTAGSIAAGTALIAASVARAQDAGVTETDVMIKTADGMTDAALYTPKGKGPFPGVLVFTDIFGLRPASRDVGRRLATNGYVAVVANPFYRTKKGPVMDAATQATFNFAKDAGMLQPHLSVLTPEATTRDELAWLAYLDSLPQVSKKAKLGVDGYCMGGPRVVQASALRPDRVGAAFTAHPGNGLVTDKPDSPHLLAPKIKAKSFFAIAESKNGVDNFRFWDEPVVLPETDDPATNVYDMRLVKHQDGWIYGVFCAERKDPRASAGDTSTATATAGNTPISGLMPRLTQSPAAT